jgi:CHAD domain-containing protein
MSKPLKVKKVSSDAPIQKTAVRILRTRIKEFYSHWGEPRQLPTLTQLHNLRISGKRLRYSAEQLRDLFPDRLALLVDLLKRNQDLLGDLQDCVTQRAVIEAELLKLRRRKPGGEEITTLEGLVGEYDQRQQMLFAQFHDIWMGMALPEFRKSLKAMVSGISSEHLNRKDFPASPVSE